VAQIFPEWTNKLPTIIAVSVLVLAATIVGLVWYYFSPWYYAVGYRPVQPVDYSHKLHADDLGLDCRYCHTSVEASPHANVPATQTCMNCHKLILPESEKLLLVRESFAKNEPIEWVRVHKVGDYAYFHHAAHMRAGVGCASCHGRVNLMPVVTQQKPLSMGWCLDCHRAPTDHLRPHEELTNMDWSPPENQAEFANRVIKEKNIAPPTDCSGCHR
jgi:hypothetical protein